MLSFSKNTGLNLTNDTLGVELWDQPSLRDFRKGGVVPCSQDLASWAIVKRPYGTFAREAVAGIPRTWRHGLLSICP
jgi:hypothetical protein